ncbi:MAG: CPBP family intramembrane metalloprotease [Clostridia bacterium]|nr:CPBP family intramembrane metalloprotease [Clostridia bacterium]
MKRMSKRQICLALALVSIILLFVCEIFGFSSLLGLEEGSRLAISLDMSVTRALGGVAFLAMLINLGYKVLDPKRSPFWRSILISLPAFVIAVNNFPFSTVISGEARVTEGAPMLLLLLLECIMVGFFEEMAFRGVIFLGILKKNPESKLWQFLSIVLSSVIFGLVHLVNLLESSPSAVFLQIGYSALIGAMCAVILLKTANIWLCVVIHGLYNFAGAVIPRMGEGRVWDTLTVVLTVIVSLAVVAYMIILFLKGKTRTTREML